MKDQLIKIMSHYNISATHFAAEIGVQRSSISHILSGRNKPSYDFILKVLEKYPDIDPYWLLTGKGNMLANAEAPKSTGEKVNFNSSENFKKNENEFVKVEKQTKSHPETIVDISNQLKKITNVTDIESIILLYTNGSFVHYKKAT